MSTTSLNTTRASFLHFFQKHGHTIIDSAPLIPRNDPTLMFTNSGMVQFKSIFTGLESPPCARATTAQKCLRAGGKHNDLDNVGYTNRHHTFFEMLGNFSFGDYFKDHAIDLAWTMVTRELGIDPERLLVTIYHTDDDAFAFWQKIAGLHSKRIIRIATDDNFWMMGATGPCGPCSEIFYDHGDHIAGGPPGSANEDGDRFIEIWNLVFMQYEQKDDGSRVPLPNQSIDTGMGIERISALLQSSNDNYATDTLRHLIEASAHHSNTDPDHMQFRTHHRVIADHIRAIGFMLAEGITPDRDGRGYVLRRIIRRAARHAHLLGQKEPFLYRLIPTLVAEMGHHYSELTTEKTTITQTLQDEEARFYHLLGRGLALLDNATRDLPENAALSGEIAFKLYDTYGFPLDLTTSTLRDSGRSVDIAGFEHAMQQQKDSARSAWQGSGEHATNPIWLTLSERLGATEFLGYNSNHALALMTALVRDNTEITTAETGDAVVCLVNQTPFYAESGGQIGDRGRIETDSGCIAITDTQKIQNMILHYGTVSSGTIALQQTASLTIDHERRRRIAGNHSATHLLHQALRDVLGDHATQRGSLNADTHLRFDFTHNAALDLSTIRILEQRVNTYIRQNSRVETALMTLENAQAIGALALFGEKYGHDVRVVSMGYRDNSGRGRDGNGYSLELCGGTHVKRTGDIGVFVITSESGQGAALRRIEALTGAAGFDYLAEQDHRLATIALALKTSAQKAPERVQSLLSDYKSAQNDIKRLRRQLAGYETLANQGAKAATTTVTTENNIALNAQAINIMIGDIDFTAHTLEGNVTSKDLPYLIDDYKKRTARGVIVLCACEGDKIALSVGVTHTLIERLSAVPIVQAAIAAIGGKGGGGRADLAFAGGKVNNGSHISTATQAVQAAQEYVRAILAIGS